MLWGHLGVAKVVYPAMQMAGATKGYQLSITMNCDNLAVVSAINSGYT